VIGGIAPGGVFGTRGEDRAPALASPFANLTGRNPGRELQKFEDLETQIEKLLPQVTQKRAAEMKERRDYIEHLRGLNMK
jgi:hypothetical protein